MHIIDRNGESKLKQKFPTPARWDDCIKTEVVVVVVVFSVYSPLRSQFLQMQ